MVAPDHHNGRTEAQLEGAGHQIERVRELVAREYRGADLLGAQRGPDAGVGIRHGKLSFAIDRSNGALQCEDTWLHLRVIAQIAEAERVDTSRKLKRRFTLNVEFEQRIAAFKVIVRCRQQGIETDRLRVAQDTGCGRSGLTHVPDGDAGECHEAHRRRHESEHVPSMRPPRCIKSFCAPPSLVVPDREQHGQLGRT